MLGIVLLIGVVAIASIGIYLVAGQTSSEIEQRSESERVEAAFLELSANLETTAAAHDVVRSTDFDLETSHGEMRLVENGEIDVLLDNDSIFGPGEREPIPLHSLEYRAADGTTVAYQGGGVWRGSGDGSIAVSTPEAHLREESLTLPIPALDAAGHSSSGTFSMERTGSTIHHSGYVTDGPLVVAVTTPYTGGWASYFESLGLANVTVEDGTVTGELETAPAIDPGETNGGEGTSGDPVEIVNVFDRAVNIEGGLDTSTGGTITGDVVAIEDSVVQMGVDGDVIVDGDVVVSDDGGDVTGDVIASGTVTVRDSVGGDVVAGGDVIVTDETNSIGGDIVAGGDVYLDPGSVGGTVTAPGDIQLGSKINRQYDALYAGGQITPPHPFYCFGPCSNHHANDGEIDDRIHDHLGTDIATYVDGIVPEPFEPLDETIQGWIDDYEGEFVDIDEDDGPLTAGTYHVDTLSVDDEQDLVFDVGDGDIDVILSGDAYVRGNVHVENEDDGVVRFWAANDFDMNSSNMCPGVSGCRGVGDSDASVIQLYGTSSTTFTFFGEPVLHGTIYAPQGEYEDDNVVFEGDGNLRIFGAVVAGGLDSEGKLTFIYDENLADTYEVPGAPGTGAGSEEEDPAEEHESTENTIRYLHVIVSDIEVDRR
ncbi:hypothetical protein GCM10025298_25070 [Natronobiforma cellulositropha]